jgi:hypothetical protein
MSQYPCLEHQVTAPSPCPNLLTSNVKVQSVAPKKFWHRENLFSPLVPPLCPHPFLTLDRSPQKTYLKSPAVRVQTPKANKLDSPSRVKRLLSFTDLEVESFEEDGLPPRGGKDNNIENIEESPSERARTTQKGRRGLSQEKVKRPVFKMVEENLPDDYDDDDTIAESIVDDGGFAGGDFGGGFADDEYEGVERDENPPVNEEDEDEDVVEIEGDVEQIQEDEEGEEEVDEEGEEVSPPPQPAKRGKGRPPNAWSKTTKSTKKPARRPQAKSSSAQPAPKRARTTGARTSPRIKERKEIPRAADLSTMDDTGTPTITISI